jgi:hypothetical protein
MRKSRISAIAIAAVAVLFVAGAAAGSVSGHHSSGPTGPLLKGHQAPQNVATVTMKLHDSVIASGDSGANLTPGGFTPIDAGEQIHCASTGTCTLEADMSVQAQGTGSGNEWAICFYVVDLGYYASCPYYGNLDSSFFENGTQIESIGSGAIPPGTHTVQTQVFSLTGGTVYNYSLTYHAYRS